MLICLVSFFSSQVDAFGFGVREIRDTKRLYAEILNRCFQTFKRRLSTFCPQSPTEGDKPEGVQVSGIVCMKQVNTRTFGDVGGCCVFNTVYPQKMGELVKLVCLVRLVSIVMILVVNSDPEWVWAD